MRSRSGNPVATCLLSVPLLAIPLMAIFGVPQFVPVIASSVNDDAFQRPRSRPRAQVGESLSPSSEHSLLSAVPESDASDVRLANLFQPTTIRREPAGSGKTPSNANAPIENTLAQNKLRDLFGSEYASPSNSELTLSVEAAEQSAQGLTWRQAVRRLNDLGIQRFWLEPGREAGEFYFACEFSPDRDPRVRRRFEAEAGEPLQAVELVLQQIDDWSPRR